MNLTLTKITNLTLLAFLFALSISTANSSNLNSYNKKSTPLILISIDGFRYDYIEKYQPPTLLSLIKNGVQAEKMNPIYPSKTFPNHITLVTGMYPKNHGIVHNSFFDESINDIYRMGKAFDNPKWMQGTPLWIHAERHGVKSASYFWPESDSKLEGISASYSYKYNKKTPYGERINQIVSWLKLPENIRPKFITSYFSLVDDKGHRFGPDSDQVRKAVIEVDRHLGNLKKRIENELKIQVNLVVVSDHGMIDISNGEKMNWTKLDDFSNYRVINGTTQLMVYAKNKPSIKKLSQHVKRLNNKSDGRYIAYLKEDLPKNTHYFNNDRIADIIVEAIAPAIFVKDDKSEHYSKGMHGYDPNLLPEMGAFFVANGPDFKSGLTIPAFDNIHVFPLLNYLLDLPMPTNIDGRLDVLKPIIK
ncbi:MAG: alkaline phosphatase family protein [Gammaproteobacteria bacterium]|nr:MAG: alkaline phosphatase family protein [Gammaproteobacteria bacterium]